MQIIYLTSLKNYPIKYGIDMDFPNEALSEEEIAELEILYNNGNPFPQGLKELLFLAGKYCYGLDYGIFNTQQEMQEYVRGRMVKYNRTITRPFFAIDIYNASEIFLFVYLDEGPNPTVYCGVYNHKIPTPEWFYEVSESLSEYIDEIVADVKAGRNPF